MPAPFDLLDPSLTAGLERLELAAGATLFEQGARGEDMFLLLRGRLRVDAAVAGEAAALVGEIAPGETVGELQLLLGGARTTTVVATEPSELCRLAPADIERLAQTDAGLAELVLATAQHRLRRTQLVTALPDLFRPLDETALRRLEQQLEWVSVRSSETLLRQGDPADAMFIVVSGRLRAVRKDRGGERALGEITRGETVGEMALFAGERREASVYAVRDSVLVRLTESAFDQVAADHPQLQRHVTRVLMQRARSASRANRAARKVVTIALMPVHESAPVSAFGVELAAQLADFGDTLHLSSARLDQVLGRPGAASTPQGEPLDLRITAWLDEQEQRHRFLLLEADPDWTPWTYRCLRQADRVLRVAEASAPPPTGVATVAMPGSPEALRRAPELLVLLHDDGSTRPSDTAAWRLSLGPDDHLHVRRDRPEDTRRVARVLAGCAVGLVLSGGGARGLAHLGVVRALRELGVPIDFVGGTSMGSFVATQTALGWDDAEMMRRTRRAFVEFRPFRTRKIPIYSFLKDRRMDESARDILFGELRLEDLWTNCFVVSCDLGSAELAVHDTGLAWRATRASSAIPGIITPVVIDGELHVDGGLLDNLPVRPMLQRCPGPVIAVDVSEAIEAAPCSQPPTLRGYLRGRFGKIPKAARFPSLVEVLARSATLGSTRAARESAAAADLVLRPPVDGPSLLQFEAIDDLAQRGYEYALVEIGAWLQRASPRW